MNTTVVQRWRDRASVYRPVGETIATGDYEVAPIAEDNPVKAFVLSHHYAASYPAARLRMGLYKRGVLAGVAVFSQPVNDLSFRPLPAEAKSVELGRFVLLDAVPANGETWFLARCFELLRKDGYEGVISFSDPMPRSTSLGRVTFKGHVGTIYQAFNGIYLGQARPGTLRLLSDGSVLHNRALAKVKKRDKGWRYVVDQLVKLGASEPSTNLPAWLAATVPVLTRSVWHPGNHKYVWPLDRSVRRLLPASKAYPKFNQPS